MIRDTYAVLKLVTGEEVLCSVLDEDEYQLITMFPMVVKLVQRFVGNKPVESVTLAPYSYFSADDEFTFQKNHVISFKDMDSNYVGVYHDAVDDFIQNADKQATNNDTMEDIQGVVDRINTAIETIVPNQNSSDSNTEEYSVDEFVDVMANLVDPTKKTIH
tara:strand:- start:1794 stop:2276 length:483 start_codon:yes stop_codon:yes gene_type:complete